MAQDVEIEISKLLRSSFIGGDSLSIRDLSRIWSLEMQWFSPDSALSLALRLYRSGWLVGNHDSVEPCPSIQDYPPEMGWRPSLSRFEFLPDSPDTDVENQTSHAMENPSKEDEDKEPYCPENPLATMTSIVSSMSGLGEPEVLRRAERKRRALGPVSLEVAILLIAREQNLEMGDLIGFLN
tara:strand:+ start:1433 stop:1978 length:546 start_codon:yes stop_codon:yes gene_type:complete